MSTPIYACRYMKALNDEEQLKRLARDVAANLKHKAMTICPCPHDPKCQMPTDKQLEELMGKIAEVAEKENLL